MKKTLGFFVLLLSTNLLGQDRPTDPKKEQRLPDILVRAQGQSPEVEAYVLRQLIRVGKIPAGQQARLRRGVSERLLVGSAPWYPRYPAASDVPSGYAGLSIIFAFGLDRLSLFIENSTISSSDRTVKWQEFLSAALSRPRSTVECSFPVVEIGQPAFQRIGAMVKDNATRDREKVELVTAAAQAYVSSPMEFSGYFEMLELLPDELLEQQVSRIGQVFRKGEPPVTGAAVLVRNLDFFTPLQRLALRKPSQFLAIQGDIRSFITREVGRSWCEADAKADSAESRARVALARRYNDFTKSLGDNVSIISDEEIERLTQGRKIDDVRRLDLSYPANVRDAFQGLGLASRNKDATADQKRGAADQFLNAWREWAAKPDGPNLGPVFDAKAGLLASSLRASATNRRDTVGAFLGYVGNHELRKTDPVLWSAMVLGFIETAKGGRAFGGRDPVDVDMIDQIRRTTKDPAILVLLEASLLDVAGEAAK